MKKIFKKTMSLILAFAIFFSFGNLNVAKARVLLMVALTKTSDKDKIQKYFKEY